MSRGPRGAFLIQKPDGRMATVQAFSARGAMKIFKVDHPNLADGLYVVRRRGSGEEPEGFKVKTR